MRVMNCNGQTIMVEGDFDSMSEEMIAEFLSSHSGACSVLANTEHKLDANKINTDLTGAGNAGFQVIEMNMNEAKSLGLYFVSNEQSSGHQSQSSVGVSEVKIGDVAVSSSESMPLLDGEVVKADEKTEAAPTPCTTIIQEENSSDLPAIGHLEDFTIPTAEDGTLLPATANAKMADGSYQLLTLIPQIVDGNVTYTVQFANFDDDCKEDKILNVEHGTDHPPDMLENPHKLEDPVDKLMNQVLNGHAKQAVTQSYNYLNLQDSAQIETKIDSIISENENVISNYKKIEYGKRSREPIVPAEIETVQTPIAINGVSKMAEIVAIGKNTTKCKRVKFKAKDVVNKQKRMKLSLLKPQVVQQKPEPVSGFGPAHINLNARLQFPNLQNVDDGIPSLPHLRVKNQAMPKQQFFNIVPSPKEKKPRHILPLDSDVGVQQAKNLISLQRFLEKQELQLQIQPITTNGTKVSNIKPKTSLEEQLKVLQDIGLTAPILSNLNKDITNSKSTDNQYSAFGDEPTAAAVASTSPSTTTTNAKDVLLSEGKLNFLKFLKPMGKPDVVEEKERESNLYNMQGGIFIKNNPDYFTKSRDSAEQHPLGSCENPIQLVQTGQTFHSRQPLSEAQLRQIASILQKQKFDTPNMKKNAIYDAKTNTRIVYRVVYPDDVDFKRPDEEEPPKKKRGRHRTRPLPEIDTKRPQSPSEPRGPGRPKTKKPSVEEEDVVMLEDDAPAVVVPKKKIPRTRSGRLSRPPRYMVKDYKRLATSVLGDKGSHAVTGYESDGGYSDYLVEEGKTQDTDPAKGDELLPGLRPQRRNKRNFKPEYRCPTCQKIYLGHTRMMWHLSKFPEHCNLQKYEEVYRRARVDKKRPTERRMGLTHASHKLKQMLNCLGKEELAALCGPLLADALTMWDFLLLRVGLMKQECEVETLLLELSLLLEKLAKVAEDVLSPVFTKETQPDNHHYVEIDKIAIAIALGLPTGVYKVNNDNLNLLRVSLKSPPMEADVDINGVKQSDPVNDIQTISGKEKSQQTDWASREKEEKTLAGEGRDYWMEEKAQPAPEWEDSTPVKALATKFEPNLSTKLLESSNDSMEDSSKYEEPPLIDLDSNSKDNSSELKESSETSESVEAKTEISRSGRVGVSEVSRMQDSTAPNGFLDSFLSARLDGEKNAKKEWIWDEKETDLLASDRLPCSRDLLASDRMPCSRDLLASDRMPCSRDLLASDRMPCSRDLLASDRLPCSRTSRLTSTPETEHRIAFDIPNRRNSISDFSNLNIEADMVLPPAKTLIKDLVQKEQESEQLKPWSGETASNSEDLMKMALDSLTSGVTGGGFCQDSSLMFNTSETDGLDFNLPLPEQLSTSSTFIPPTFQSTLPATVSPNFLSSSYCSTATAFDNFQNKEKTKLEDVMEFFEDKMNQYDSNFPFENHSESFAEEAKKKKKKQQRGKAAKRDKTVGRGGKKVKAKVDYSKSSSIESIINEALFETTAGSELPSQATPNNLSLPSGSIASIRSIASIASIPGAFSLPSISESLDEVGNLDFFNQD